MNVCLLCSSYYTLQAAAGNRSLSNQPPHPTPIRIYTYNLNIGRAHAVCTMSVGAQVINGTVNYQNKVFCKYGSI